MDAWTNPSVRGLAGRSDPLEAMTVRSRALVLEAVQKGWKGPPFDPFQLAQILGIGCVPTEDVPEARVVRREGRLEIEFNPNRPRQRVRFSVAHEIAHTLFPDCAQVARNRGASHSPGSDGWQLELLCNLAASEFLMPTGDELDPGAVPDVDRVLELQGKFDVSIEAVAIRLAGVTRSPCTVTVAARVDEGDPKKGFRVDYSIPSRSSSVLVPRGATFKGEVFGQCTAVGFTAKGAERLPGRAEPLYLECVGLPPYPGSSYPRVLGIAQGPAAAVPLPTVSTVRGDALSPRGDGPKIIAMVVNDKGRTWGGGFSQAARERYPAAHEQFKEWTEEGRRNLSLGRIHLAELKGGLAIASLVAQKGYGPSPTPRIRYTALGEALSKLSKAAADRKASVHMPEIGSGLAGGNWSVIRQMVDDALAAKGVRVTVYTLPGKGTASRKTLGGGMTRLDEAFGEPGEHSE